MFLLSDVEKKRKHTKQAPVKKWHCMFRTGRVDVLVFFGRSVRTALVDCCRLLLFV